MVEPRHDAAHRTFERQIADLLDQADLTEAARKHYAVAVDPETFELDVEATERLRAAPAQ